MRPKVNRGEFEDDGWEYKNQLGHMYYLEKGDMKLTVIRDRLKNLTIREVRFQFLQVNHKGEWEHRMTDVGAKHLPSYCPPDDRELREPLSVPHTKVNDHDYLIDRIQNLKELC